MRVLLVVGIAAALVACSDDSGSGQSTAEACAAFRDVEDDLEFEEIRDVVLEDVRSFTQEANRVGGSFADLAHDYRGAMLEWFDAGDREEYPDLPQDPGATDEAFDELVDVSGPHTESISDECCL